MVSPRTRNLPRTRLASLRSYCMSTSWRRMARWSLVSPTRATQQLRLVLLGRAQAVDARHRGHHDRVTPSQQSGRRRMAQPIDLVVDRRVLLDVRVGRGHVRLGLVVVVVRHEVLDPVLREELTQLVGQLRRQRLVGRHHERGPLHLLDRPRDGRALATAGDAEQRLARLARPQTLGQRGDRLGLVTRGREVGHDLEGSARRRGPVEAPYRGRIDRAVHRHRGLRRRFGGLGRGLGGGLGGGRTGHEGMVLTPTDNEPRTPENANVGGPGGPPTLTEDFGVDRRISRRRKSKRRRSRTWSTRSCRGS